MLMIGLWKLFGKMRLAKLIASRLVIDGVAEEGRRNTVMVNGDKVDVPIVLRPRSLYAFGVKPAKSELNLTSVPTDKCNGAMPQQSTTEGTLFDNATEEIFEPT